MQRSMSTGSARLRHVCTLHLERIHWGECKSVPPMMQRKIMGKPRIWGGGGLCQHFPPNFSHLSTTFSEKNPVVTHVPSGQG